MLKLDKYKINYFRAEILKIFIRNLIFYTCQNGRCHVLWSYLRVYISTAIKLTYFILAKHFCKEKKKGREQNTIDQVSKCGLLTFSNPTEHSIIKDNTFSHRAKPSSVQEYICLWQVGSTPCTNKTIIGEEEGTQEELYVCHNDFQFNERESVNCN